MLVSVFRSPATTAAFAETISGSKLPPCHFASQPAGCATRSALLLHYRIRFAPEFRPLPRFWPVATLPACRTCVSSSLHSPLGLLPPSGSTRSTGFAVRRPAFRTRPIPLAPHSRFLSLGTGCGSSFLVRYVSGGLLFLQPLGTFFTMRREPFLVKWFLVLLTTFPQHLSLVFRDSYTTIAWIRCE